MQKIVMLVLLCLVLTGCGSHTPPEETAVPTMESTLQIGNPWKSYDTLAEAEAACGLDFPLEDVVAGSYMAESYRVMQGQLMEVTYRDDIFEVTVRMQAGEDQDISGVYEEFKNITTFDTDSHTIVCKKIKDGGILQLISKDGFSYSFYAPNHYWGDSNADFLAFLNQ